MPFGACILDAAAAAVRLAVEIYGESRFAGDGPRRDATRDAFLNEHGWRVVRGLDADVRGNLDGVQILIAGAVETDPPPGPLAEGEGEASR